MYDFITHIADLHLAALLTGAFRWRFDEFSADLRDRCPARRLQADFHTASPLYASLGFGVGRGLHRCAASKFPEQPAIAQHELCSLFSDGAGALLHQTLLIGAVTACAIQYVDSVIHRFCDERSARSSRSKFQSCNDGSPMTFSRKSPAG